MLKSSASFCDEIPVERVNQLAHLVRKSSPSESRQARPPCLILASIFVSQLLVFLYTIRFWYA